MNHMNINELEVAIIADMRATYASADYPGAQMASALIAVVETHFAAYQAEPCPTCGSFAGMDAVVDEAVAKLRHKSKGATS